MNTTTKTKFSAEDAKRKAGEMMDAVQNDALDNLIANGEVRPTAFVINPVTFKPEILPMDFSTEQTKQRAMQALRLIGEMLPVPMMAMVCEAWSVKPAQGEDIERLIPSESPRRVEILVIQAQVRGFQAELRLLEMLRDKETRKIIGLKPVESFDAAEGRMMGLLPIDPANVGEKVAD